MELNKNVLEDTVSCRLREIQEKREELDRMEAEVIRKMLRDDMDNKLLIGQQLDNSVQLLPSVLLTCLRCHTLKSG